MTIVFRLSRAAIFLALLAASLAFAQADDAAAWKSVEDALGRHGTALPGNVYKFGLPRADMHVTVQGVAIQPALALGSWLAFKRVSGGAIVMGDLVLLEDEVEPVMLKLQQAGIEQTALHNHVLNESPRVMYMHVSGHGDSVQLARSLHDALALTGTPAPAPPAPPAKLDLDQAQLESILGRKGSVNGGVLQFSVPRAESISEHGTDIPPSMGTATAINFQPTGNGRVAITGDFVLLGSEVNPVIKTLRENGIDVTAIHSHMLEETPRLFFMHFWANHEAVALARGLRAALDRTNSAQPTAK
ncbi:MAG TPA: DUF1259 domain-containing protein [Terriglobales bacterium]